jgi:hypothetical protein
VARAVARPGLGPARPAGLARRHRPGLPVQPEHYYVGQGSNSFAGGSVSSSIASWVSAHYTAQTVGGSTVYDLTKPAT